MAPPSLPPVRTVGDRAQVPLPTAALGWAGAWLLGNVLAAAVFAASGHETVAEAGPGWLALSSLGLWIPLVAMVVGLGRKFGRDHLVADYGVSFRPVDLVGIPAGVLAQLVVLPLVYLPLQHFWPGTFSDDRLEERARDLWDNAHGAGLALLVVVVVVGAPLVEELVYRGLLQGALTRRLDDVVGLVAAALWFAAIHFQPVEFPGLFMIGLVLGVCMWRTGRLGMPILAHVAFNATGLALAAGR